MYLKKSATALISTVMILALMSILGCSMYKMMKNNNELGSLYKYDKDIYDLDKEEEEVLYNFMKELNKIETEKFSQSGEEGSEDDIFDENFEKKINNSILDYNKNDNKLFLITHNSNGRIRKREILYKFYNKKIKLIPTYKFENKYE